MIVLNIIEDVIGDLDVGLQLQRRELKDNMEGSDRGAWRGGWLSSRPGPAQGKGGFWAAFLPPRGQVAFSNLS